MILWYDMIWYHLNGWIGPREFPWPVALLQPGAWGHAQRPGKQSQGRCCGPWGTGEKGGGEERNSQERQISGSNVLQRWPRWEHEIVIGWISGLFHAIGPNQISRSVGDVQVYHSWMKSRRPSRSDNYWLGSMSLRRRDDPSRNHSGFRVLEGRDLHRFGTIQRVCLILDLEGWDSQELSWLLQPIVGGGRLWFWLISALFVQFHLLENWGAGIKADFRRPMKAMCIVRRPLQTGAQRVEHSRWTVELSQGRNYLWISFECVWAVGQFMNVQHGVMQCYTLYILFGRTTSQWTSFHGAHTAGVMIS